MMVAPGITAPDLSTTLPEKLPVAWPWMAGETMSAKTHAPARSSSLRGFASSILQDFESAESSTGLGHFALTIVRFIVKPLFKNSDEVADASTAVLGIIRMYGFTD
jgi:hypothetical protein